ncbi:hypothetical protein B0I31_1043 [Saccharothrix carnea]|uniref:Uncharacterized protein n=1 Tax=Saccharothrix carnea TaxID=1280637 RepID=A0A2P8IB70_SACCR|nr:hypothetical protein [Saccharothrix carnea]PSL55712.1 hypothetical protein B0I31_1043 [Saccharothrix carnea]
MVTNFSPTTISTPPPGDSGFTMDPAAMEGLQQQADELRTGYLDVSSSLSGRTLAGNALGTTGTFATEAFNASLRTSVELAGKAASTLGLVGEGLQATAQTQQEADRSGADQLTKIEPGGPAQSPPGAPAGGAGGGAPSQGPPVSPVESVPGGTSQPGPEGTTQTSQSTAPGGGAPTDQVPPAPTGSGAPSPAPSGAPGQTASANPQQQAAPQPAPVPAFPEIPDPPPVPDGSASGGSGATGGSAATPAGGTTPPPTPPIPEVPKDLFKQPTIPDPTSGSSGAPGGSGASGSSTGTAGGSATTPSGGMTPPPIPPIPEVPKDLFKQPTIPDPTTGGSSGAPGGSGASGSETRGGSATAPSGGMTPPPMPPIPEVPKDLFKQPTIPDLTTGGSSGVPGGSGTSGGGAGTPSPTGDGPGDRGDRDPSGEERPTRDPKTGEQGGGGEHGGGGGAGGGGEDDGRPQPDRHGFPVTEVDGKPCLDLRDLPAEEGERWQENIRDILATKGEGSFFWAGDTIDAEGQRHSLMDLAEFMTNLDARTESESGTGPEPAVQPGREVSDTVAASPARSANGDVYVLVGPNRAEGDPVELADFPTLRDNPRIERVFAIDAVTGREVQIHPKVS